jgi:hypothetical protein
MASLFLGGEEQAIFSRAVEQVPAAERPSTLASGAVPILRIEEFGVETAARSSGC